MTLDTFLSIFYVQTTLSGIIALGSFYKFSSRQKLTRLIGLLFLISFICNVTAITTEYVNETGSVYDLLLIVVASFIYNHVTNGKYAKPVLFVATAFLIFAVFNLIFLQWGCIASYNKLLSSFIIMLDSVFYFYKLMAELPTVHLQRLPMFWFNSAFLLYHAGTIFLFAFTPYLVNIMNDNLLIYWTFHNLLSILQQLIVLLGLVYDFRNRGVTAQS